MRSIACVLLSLTAVPGFVTSQEAPRPAPKAQRVDSVMEVGPRDRVRVLTMRRARLGVSVNLQAEESDSIGALIQSVTPNSPAARAGLQSGDIITRFNGKPLIGEGFT
ncbi:MAG: PDZ domain-containing protein, partial [Gemmatimonadota bacterium]|nr:PDZ domain-containing protein [Gemmatimonadota bacterium]